MKGAAFAFVLIAVGTMGGALSLVHGATPVPQAAKPLIGDCAVVALAEPSLQRALGCPLRTAGR
jgi:hypothetical protein